MAYGLVVMSAVVRFRPQCGAVVVTQLVAHDATGRRDLRRRLAGALPPLRGSCGIPSTWCKPDPAAPRAQHPDQPPPILPSLHPGCRVVALGEVDGMPHPLHTSPSRARRTARPPVDLPARRGHGHFGVNADTA